MYKFEISADSPSELEAMQFEWARNLIGQHGTIAKPSTEYLDDADVANPLVNFPETENKVENVFPINLVTPQSLGTPSVTAGANAHFDSHGLPWDERIHASSKNTNKDGTWRYRKQIPDDVIQKVESELIGKIKSGAINNSVTLPPPPAPTVAVSMPSFAASPTLQIAIPAAQPIVQAQPAVAMPDYANVPIPQATKPAHSLNTFKANMSVVLAELINAGKITPDYIQKVKDYFEIKDIWNLLGDEAKLIKFFDSLCDSGLITRMEG